ncbi:hypothetical protein I4200191B4_12450 [Pseudoflavonifractor gallinarum]
MVQFPLYVVDITIIIPEIHPPRKDAIGSLAGRIEFLRIRADSTSAPFSEK